jgi:hypothetical protein
MKLMWLVFLTVWICACSGGSGTMISNNDDGGIGGTGLTDDGGVGGTGATDDDGGIGGTGISSGPIEDFGSIFVNGVRFETDASTVIVEGGRPIAVPDVETLQRYLKRGMVVQVHGTVNPDGKTGVADQIFYGDTVQGAITTMDPAAGRMTILGREVLVDSATRVGNAPYHQHPLSFFSVGNVVEVSGMPTADGAILATWIGLLDTDASGSAFDVETRGTVSGHDATAKTFVLGDIQVQYGGVSENRRPADLADGQNLEVRGRSLSAAQTTVEATDIAVVQDDLPLNVGETFWLQGVVTQMDAPSTLEVGDRGIVLDAEAVFSGGTSADLRLNARIEVQGTVDESGAWLARRVVFPDPPSFTISLDQPGSLESKEGEKVVARLVTEASVGASPVYAAQGLPPGLTLDAVRGIISGILSCESAGVYHVNVSLEGTLPTTWVWTVDEACVAGPPLPTNRPPIFINSGDHTSVEGEDILLELDGVDPDGDVLTYSATGLPSGFVLDATTGILTGTPPCTAAGLGLITLSVMDGTFTDSISFTWTIEGGC